jgi:hypothetical protein
MPYTAFPLRYYHHRRAVLPPLPRMCCGLVAFA